MPKEKIGDVELYYEVQGEGDEIIAFVNGVGMSVNFWSNQYDFFNKEFKCVLHDTRGQLKSEKPDMDYTMEMHADDLKNLLDHLNIKKVHLIGTSYGSEISMIFAYKYPEMVKTLSVVTGISELDDLCKVTAESWKTAADFDPVSFFRIMLPWNYSNEFVKNNKDFFTSREASFKHVPRDYFEGFKRLIDAFLDLNITKEIRNIKCPTIIVSADKDLIKGPKFGELIHENIPNSEFHIIKDSGHAVVMEKPEELNKLLYDFIKKNI